MSTLNGTLPFDKGNVSLHIMNKIVINLISYFFEQLINGYNIMFIYSLLIY